MTLASCKYSNCEQAIDVKDIKKIMAIPKAPHHVAFVAKCPSCGRAGQYVIERELLDEASGVASRPGSDRFERAMAAAAIELNAIDGVDDLIALWDSYPTPPPIDGHAGKCLCDECKRRRYGKR